jgi:hypothetical protein
MADSVSRDARAGKDQNGPLLTEKWPWHTSSTARCRQRSERGFHLLILCHHCLKLFPFDRLNLDEPLGNSLQFLAIGG